jgi:hypothetical protein
MQRLNKRQLSAWHTILLAMQDGVAIETDPPITDDTREEDEPAYYTWKLFHPNSLCVLQLSDDLAAYLQWPKIYEIHDGEMIPMRRLMPQRQSASLMMAGIEQSHFQGNEMKPYLESLRLWSRSKADVYFTLGGTAQGRLWDGQHWEKKWVQPICAPIRHINVWTEDMYGERHMYHNEAEMHACLMWRKRPRQMIHCEGGDALEGEHVAEFDGKSGMLLLGGGVKDFSGGLHKNKKSYEVCVRAMSQSYCKVWTTMIPHIAYMQLTAPEFLEGDGILYNAPWNVMADGPREEEDDSLWYPHLAVYKRIRPENFHHTPLNLHIICNTTGLHAEEQEPVRIRRTKVVLHIRQMRDQSVAT